MENQLERYLGYFGLIHDAIKFLSTGASHFEPSAFDMFSSNIKTGSMLTKNAINYIDEQIRFTQVEYKNAYVEGIISQIKDIDMCLFANYNQEGKYIYTDDTKSLNLLLLPIRTTNPESPQEVYLANCISSIREFYVEFVSLCAKYKINIDKSLKRADITIICDIERKTDTFSTSHFTRIFNEEEINILYSGLKGRFMPEDLDFEHFCFVFGGIPLTPNKDPFKPLQWIRSQYLLAYFIYQLFSDTDSKNFWNIACNCFENKEKPLNPNTMKKDMSDLKNGEKDKPKGFDKIDDLINSLQ